MISNGDSIYKSGNNVQECKKKILFNINLNKINPLDKM